MHLPSRVERRRDARLGRSFSNSSFGSHDSRRHRPPAPFSSSSPLHSFLSHQGTTRASLEKRSCRGRFPARSSFANATFLPTSSPPPSSALVPPSTLLVNRTLRSEEGACAPRPAAVSPARRAAASRGPILRGAPEAPRRGFITGGFKEHSAFLPRSAETSRSGSRAVNRDAAVAGGGGGR